MPDPRARRIDEVEVGDLIPARDFAVDRDRLVRYAGASLDFNPIHWSESAARRSGLPDVIAHGMLTMALAGRLVTDWAGDPGAVADFATRFSSMVPVPDGVGATVTIGGAIVAKLEPDRVRVELTVESEGRPVLKGATAVVGLAPARPRI
jgi:acyl dehydratase